MILLDTNVLLDVLQRREPHYRASAAVIDRVVRGHHAAVLPAHAVTTVHFIVRRYQGKAVSDKAIDWLLDRFGIAAVGRPELIRARVLQWPDFEDAVVAAAAQSCSCEAIITRNVKDFRDSPIPAMTPEEYLFNYEAAGRP